MYKWIFTYQANGYTATSFCIKDHNNFAHEDWMGEVGTYTCEIVDITAEIALEECYKQRRAAYGSIQDQLDEQFHDFEAWKARIAAIKAQFPKP